jgi:hypothetical protein
MRRFVFDEWLWADLSGENGGQAQTEAFQLLQAVFKKCDQLVAVQGSPFLQKFYDLAEKASTGDPRRNIVKAFKDQFLENSEKLCLLQEGDLPEIPEKIEQKVKEDDKYLVRACLAGQVELLVTTDSSLIDVLNECHIRCQDRKTFMSNYLG